MVTAPFTGDAVVQVARSLAETDEALAGVRNRLLLLGLLTTVAAAAVGWLTARRIARPIEELADGAERVARTQELDTPFAATGPDEVGRLAASLTSMLAALDRSRRQQRQLVADAGHELKTPLTTLRTSVELLQRDDLTPHDRDRLLRTVSAEVGELTTLVTEIVDLGTDAARTEPAQPCDLREVADAVAERAQRRHGRPVEVSGPSVHVVAQPAMLDRAITNLVDNAVKFSPPGSPVSIAVEADRVSVRDHGPGIDAADLPHVFERFYRSTAARTLPGSGLGLAIVAHVAEAHGGAAFAAQRRGSRWRPRCDRGLHVRPGAGVALGDVRRLTVPAHAGRPWWAAATDPGPPLQPSGRTGQLESLRSPYEAGRGL